MCKVKRSQQGFFKFYEFGLAVESWFNFGAMLLKEIIGYLEQLAPPSLQESYDNSGLITGHPEMEISGAIICLDSTEDVIDEAISKKCNLVIAHHPIVFSGLKKITGKNYIERTVIKAIRNEIAIYAIHTNLDNVAMGVNKKIGEKLGLIHTRILEPKAGNLLKMVVFVPVSHEEKLRNAMFEAGAGKIGDYDECSFQVNGNGTFRAGLGTKPFAGEIGKRHSEPEVRIETILPDFLLNSVVASMKSAHPYEEVAYDLFSLKNEWLEVGSGLIGELPEAMEPIAFLKMLKINMKTDCVRHTTLGEKQIRKVALCGGSGSFLLKRAMAEKADILVTADFKYHQFFDAEGRIIIADIGHYESEQFTGELLNDWLRQKFPTFASHLTEVITNPVQYF